MTTFSWYKRIDWGVVLLVLFIAMIIAFAVIALRGVAKDAEARRQERIATFDECKTKIPSDVDWCIENTLGIQLK